MTRRDISTAHMVDTTQAVTTADNDNEFKEFSVLKLSISFENTDWGE